MKNINWTLNEVERRTVAFLLAMLLIITSIFTSMIRAGFVAPERALAVEGRASSSVIDDTIIRDDALHFIFRHWHTNWDNEATMQSEGDARRRDQYDADTQRYFVMVEGYIIPHNPGEMKDKDPANQYTIVLVNQANGQLVPASQLYGDYVEGSYLDDKDRWAHNKVQNSKGEDEIVLKNPHSPYLGEMNKTTGSIELKVKKLADVYTVNGEEIREDTEKFCGVSLSAGRGAATLMDKEGEKDRNGNDIGDGETDTIHIEYSKDTPTHIVKGHIFYSSWTKTVTGTNDPRIINGMDPEVDTAEVYTWKADGTYQYGTKTFEHKEDDIVAYKVVGEEEYQLVDSTEEDSKVVMKGDEAILKALGLDKIAATKEDSGEVMLTTFYSSHEGMHTNKTLMQSADGRYFLFDLEAWYIEGYAAQLGYIIDASGSMAGTSDVPSILNIYNAIAGRLGVVFDETKGIYKYTHTDEEVVPATHEHKLKTCSMPYYEVQNTKDNNKTLIIRETEIKAVGGGKIDRSIIEDIELGGKKGSVKYQAFEEEGTVYKILQSKSGTVKTLTGDVVNAADLKYMDTYYSPSDAERRIDMEKFLVKGDRYTSSTSKHEGYCWAGLVKEFGKAELCATISNTIGDGYLFTEEMWDQVTSLKGAAGKIGEQTTFTSSPYPKLDYLIGYYNFNGSTTQNGAKYVLDASTDFEEKGPPAGTTNATTNEQRGTNGFFTVQWYSTNNKVLENKEAKFDDGYDGTKYISFGGNSKKDQRTIKFTTNKPATVKVWWQNSSATNRRKMTVLDSSGVEIAESGYLNPSDFGIFQYEITSSGTYYLSGWDRDVDKDNGKANFIYRVEVKESGSVYNSGYDTDATANSAPKHTNGTVSLVEQTAFNGSYSFDTVADNGPLTGDKLVKGNNGAGVLLDAKPSSGNFTISFTITTASSGDQSTQNNQKLGQLLYIGALSGDIGKATDPDHKNGYYTLYRDEAGSRYRLRGNSQAGRNNNVTDINDVFRSGTTQTVTLVFKGGKVYAYLNGKLGIQDSSYGPGVNGGTACSFADTEDINIILNGIRDEYNGAQLSIDDVYVYDVALSSDDVLQLYNAQGHDFQEETTETRALEWDDVFINAELLNLFMNPNNTAHVPLGVAAYNYYVFTANGNEIYPLAYWEGARTESRYSALFAKTTQGDTVLGELREYDTNDRYKAGWYYLSHRSDTNILLNVGTSKTLTALTKGAKYYDNVLLDIDYNKMSGTGKKDDFDTSKEYTIETAGDTTKFYIDKNGNLRCFYSGGCSYVYELDDSQYVKTEALQRILAYFSAELSEKTPSSQIAAVQFSHQNRKIEDLPLLDWSSTADEIAAILSQKYGEDIEGKTKDEDYGGKPGYASGWAQSNGGVKQHNFALTGGTRTDLGFHSFLQDIVLKGVIVERNSNNTLSYYEKKAPGEKGAELSFDTIKNQVSKYRRDDPNAPKFVIVFTDGADDNASKQGTANPSYPFAQALKELDYTVIGIYLPAGTDPRKPDGSLSDDEGTVYHTARIFLEGIAGDLKGSDPAGFVFASTDIGAVADIFDQKIMESINGIMSGYTVQEYIDTRFDLQTADGTVWHLGANGEVTIESSQNATGKDKDGNPNYAKILVELSDGSEFVYYADGGTYTLPKRLNGKLGALFHLTGDNTNGAARDAYLRYDSSKDMYYLIWENQTIQSSPVGSKFMMPVWSVEYWLVAKDDFIGGDAVLTSGNEKNMNYISHLAERSEEEYANYAFSSWLNLSDSLRAEYDARWHKAWTENNTEAYKAMWMELTAAEQEAMVWAWKNKYPNANVSVGSFTEGKDEQANGARIMFMIVQMNLKRTNEYDASSGTSDMIKTHPDDPNAGTVTAANGNQVPMIDDFPSKGFPRIAVNVSPKGASDEMLEHTIYLGELMSPVFIINDMVNVNPKNAYLNYLMRYAYYLYPDEDTPLIELLTKWDGIEPVNNIKSFSVPYMYLPNYQYDAYGNVIKNMQLNNAGTEAHWGDVLGILTYRLQQVGDNNGEIKAVETAIVNDETMSVWGGLQYKLTVEFTTFHIGDKYSDLETDFGSTADIFPNFIATGNVEAKYFLYDRAKYFTSKLKTEESTEAWEGLVSETEMRKVKVEGDGETEGETETVEEETLVYQPTVRTEGKDNNLAAPDTDSEGSGEGTDTVDKNMVTVAALAELMGISEEEAEEIASYKEVSIFNNGRTQQANFQYIPTVVGGELALELRVTATEAEWKSLNLSQTITVTATREFTDNDRAEYLKANYKNDDGTSLADYGDSFTITFTFIKPEDATSVGDVYTIYATACVHGTFGGKPVMMSALPIGDYSFGTNAVNASNIPRLKMSSTLGFENDVDKFDAGYFDKNRELFGTQDNPNDVTGNIAYSSGNTIHFGSKMVNDVSNYKTRSSNGEAWIRDHGSRIAIIDTSASISPDAQIVIVEKGGQSNESFLYHVTGKAADSGKTIDLIVSVKGGGSTTIIVPIGTYTVEEIPSWSWRYENGVAKATQGTWTISESDTKIAKTVVDTSETRIVTYSHEPNNKGWLGGENYKDYFFEDSHE